MHIKRSAFALPQGWFGRLGGWWMARSNRPVTVWAAATLELQPADRVLDLGSGPGVGLALSARRLRSGMAVGIDPSADMHAQASKRNRRALHRGRVGLAVAQVSTLPFPDACFDKAVSVNAVRLWPDPVHDLGEVRRVLRPGGRLVLVMHAHDAERGSQIARQQQECIQWLEQAGLSVLQALTKPIRGMPALRVVAQREVWPGA